MKEKMILVAVDNSDYSRKALEKAIELSKLMDTKILLVHCHRRFPTMVSYNSRRTLPSECDYGHYR